MKQTNEKNLSTARITLDLNKLIETSHAFPRTTHDTPRRSHEQKDIKHG